MPLSSDQQAEIDQARAGAQPTLRPVAPALEEILYQALPVLDHGFVRVVDYMGDDAAVVQAARVSYGRGTKKVSEDPSSRSCPTTGRARPWRRSRCARSSTT
jgi:thymidylate synthase (FAD)